MIEDAPIAQARLTISSRLEGLPQVRELIETSAAQMDFTEQEVQRIVTAAFEAVANAATHGSPMGGRNSITVVTQVFPDRFVVEVRDQGDGITHSILPDMPTTESSRGRGLPLMRALMDEVNVSNDGGCRVVLVKYRR
jgi:serine/threonine-protein kinase RsbW